MTDSARCSSCGDALVNPIHRDDATECLPCWEAAMHHGHVNGLHESFVPDCPDCAADYRQTEGIA